LLAIRNTLRYRLTLAFLMWTAGIQLVTAGVFVLGRELLVVSSVDRALTDAALLLRRGLEADPSWPPALEQASFDLQTQPSAPLIPLVLRARSMRGETIARWPDRDPPPELAAPISKDPAAGLEFASLRMAAQSDEDDRIVPVRFRCASMEIHTVEGVDYRLDFGTSLELADRTTSVMWRILAAGLTVGIVGAGIAGWIVAGRASRRIEKVTSEVEKVSPTRLDEPHELPTGSDEIGRMGQAVNAMLGRLANAFRSQEYFISNVSHELKTPIASMLAEAQVLKSSQTDPELLRAFAGSVEEETRRLGALVETFLAMARFSEGRPGRAEALISMNDTAMDSLHHNDMFARQQSILVKLDLADPGEMGDIEHEPLVRGDAHLLRVAVDNLLRNAISVSQPGDPVEVAVSIQDQVVSVRVSDHGPGVPPGFVDKMFDRFAKRADRSVGQRGTGLGLNITKSIVDLHGGKIEVTNAPDSGAVFTLRLPLARRAEAHDAPAAAGNGSVSKG
jgi:signal transduction histidine kinase